MAIQADMQTQSPFTIAFSACAVEPEYVEEATLQEDMESRACQGERSLFEEFPPRAGSLPRCSSCFEPPAYDRQR